MKPLVDFVLTHTVMQNTPNFTENGSVDMYFFRVSKNEAQRAPSPEEFVRLTNEHEGEFCILNPFDKGEHSYINLGGWIGDQGIALRYMALGQILGLWKVLQPKLFFDLAEEHQKATADKMAGMGFVSIVPA